MLTFKTSWHSHYAPFLWLFLLKRWCLKTPSIYQIRKQLTRQEAVCGVQFTPPSIPPVFWQSPPEQTVLRMWKTGVFLRAMFTTRESKLTVRDSNMSDVTVFSWFYHVITKFLLTCKLTENWKMAFLSNSGTLGSVWRKHLFQMLVFEVLHYTWPKSASNLKSSFPNHLLIS